MLVGHPVFRWSGRSRMSRRSFLTDFRFSGFRNQQHNMQNLIIRQKFMPSCGAHFFVPLRSVCRRLFCSSLPRVASNLTEGKELVGKNAALLVDGDIYGPYACIIMLQYLMPMTTLSVKRIYVTEHKANSWGVNLATMGFEIVVVERWKHGSKDPTDIFISMDAVELALRGGISALALAARDVDFAHIHRRMLQFDITSIHVVPYGSEAVPPLVQLALHESSSGDLFISVDSEGKAVCGSSRESTYSKDDDEVIGALTDLSFLHPSEHTLKGTVSLRMGIATFVHINELSDFHEAYFPFHFPQHVLPALGKLMNRMPTRSWISKPNDLWCYEGVSNHKSPQSKRAIRSWPFVYLFITEKSSILEDVLVGFGYLDDQRNASLSEALQLFIRMQSLGASAHGLLMQETFSEEFTVEETASRLNELLRRRDILQQWRLPRKDTGVRSELFRRNYTNSRDAPEKSVMVAMGKYLSSINEHPGLTYNFRVWQCIQNFHVAKDPNTRA